MNKNRARLMQFAMRDLAKKLKLESLLKPRLRSLLIAIVKNFKNNFNESNQEVVPVDYYIAKLTVLLRQHYWRVTNVFNADPHIQIKAFTPTAPIVKTVMDRMAEYILLTSKRQARIIITTVSNDLNDGIFKVVNEAVSLGKPVSPKQISNMVSLDYLRKINGKLETIAVTETQTTAETVKQYGFEELADERRQVADPTTEDLEKEWVSILDKKTRPWHAAADGQRVKIDSYFIVKGEKLMYPGDSSAGVSLDNIIHCRCSQVLVQRGE